MTQYSLQSERRYRRGSPSRNKVILRQHDETVKVEDEAHATDSCLNHIGACSKSDINVVSLEQISTS